MLLAIKQSSFAGFAKAGEWNVNALIRSKKTDCVLAFE